MRVKVGCTIGRQSSQGQQVRGFTLDLLLHVQILVRLAKLGLDTLIPGIC